MVEITKNLGLAIQQAEQGIIPYDGLVAILQTAINNGDILLEENQLHAVAAIFPLIDEGLLVRSPYVDELEHLMNSKAKAMVNEVRNSRGQEDPGRRGGLDSVHTEKPKRTQKKKRFRVVFHAGHISNPASLADLEYWLEQGAINHDSLVTDIESGRSLKLHECLGGGHQHERRPSPRSPIKNAPSAVEPGSVIPCQFCGTKLRLRDSRTCAKIRCPNCGMGFTVNTPGSPGKGANRSSLIRYALAIFLIGLPILVFFIFIGSGPEKATLHSDKSGRLRISYADLVDIQQLTHSGGTVGDWLRQSSETDQFLGEVQPFLDPFARLLIDVQDMISGPSFPPFVDIAEYFPVGSAQPAWAALLRAGKFVAAFDGVNRAMVFVPGTDPSVSFNANYGVLRQILAGLVGEDSSPISIEVFAFKNDFKTCELVLNPTAHRIESNQFVAPQGMTPIDVEGLTAFFEHNPVLEGAAITQDSGLTLFGTKGDPQTIAGRPLALTDLAVAYRAAVHAGENSAYVSLDPHEDPTLVTVNFGGYLEDTALGQVVLEADKRFKTLTSGLDPNTFRDVRTKTRRKIDGFRTSSEREVTDSGNADIDRWTSTRFWFYPDKIKVETDFDSRYARIVDARFLADAERSRADFADNTEFDQLKKQTLSPAIRNSIDHLNDHYASYSANFPEFRELDTVARLMAISAWMASIENPEIDLDSLLSVEIEPFQTEREKTKLLSATTICVDETSVDPERDNANRAVVTNLTPILNRPVESHFQVRSAARFLALQQKQDPSDSDVFLDQARAFMATNKDKRVRDIIYSEADLQALASEAAGRVEVALPARMKSLEMKIDATASEIAQTTTRLKSLEGEMDRSPEAHNRLVGQYNRLVKEHNYLLEKHNDLVSRFNSARVATSHITEIGGGIDLRPSNFNILARSGSPMVKVLLDHAGTPAENIGSDAAIGTWFRSSTRLSGLAKAIAPWRRDVRFDESQTTPSVVVRQFEVTSTGRYWSLTERGPAVWRDQWSRNSGGQKERYFNPENKQLQIVERSADGAQEHVTVIIDSPGHISLRRSESQPIADPGSPPYWASRPQ